MFAPEEPADFESQIEEEEDEVVAVGSRVFFLGGGMEAWEHWLERQEERCDMYMEEVWGRLVEKEEERRRGGRPDEKDDEALMWEAGVHAEAEAKEQELKKKAKAEAVEEDRRRRRWLQEEEALLVQLLLLQL